MTTIWTEFSLIVKKLGRHEVDSTVRIDHLPVGSGNRMLDDSVVYAACKAIGAVQFVAMRSEGSRNAPDPSRVGWCFVNFEHPHEAERALDLGSVEVIGLPCPITQSGIKNNMPTEESSAADVIAALQSALSGALSGREASSPAALDSRRQQPSQPSPPVARPSIPSEAVRELPSIDGNHAATVGEERKEAATRLQSAARGRQAKKSAGKKRRQKVAAHKIQTVQRGRSTRTEMKNKAEAARKIQTVQRGRSSRKRGTDKNRVVVAEEGSFASAQSGRATRKQAVARNEAATVLQSAQRGRLARRDSKTKKRDISRDVAEARAAKRRDSRSPKRRS
eukprot:SAG22_NODE_92_length_20892_cov_11.188429_5_plen_336_part_00